MDHDLDTNPTDDDVDNPFSERICQNCSCFFHHNDDDDNLGVCSLNKNVAACFDDKNVMDNFNFSNCWALYQQYCFDGQQEACESFESVEMDIPEGMSVETCLYIERMREADPDDLFHDLKQADREKALDALVQICSLIRRGNLTAFTNLIDYCLALDPATTLTEVDFRIKLLKHIEFLPRHEKYMELIIKELARTPSNNMTRRLYTKALQMLRRYPQDEIRAPLERLLHEVPYSYKIKRRIKEVAGLIEPEETGWLIHYPGPK